MLMRAQKAASSMAAIDLEQSRVRLGVLRAQAATVQHSVHALEQLLHLSELSDHGCFCPCAVAQSACAALFAFADRGSPPKGTRGRGGGAKVGAGGRAPRGDPWDAAWLPGER